MKLWVARALFLLLAAASTLLGVWAFWTQPTAYAYADPTLYSVPGAALFVALVGIVACFAPFDRPQSAPRWAAPLAGLAAGVGLSGLFLFTPTFLFLSGPLLIYGLALVGLARVIAAGPPDLELGTQAMAVLVPTDAEQDPDDEFLGQDPTWADDTTPVDPTPAPTSQRGSLPRVERLPVSVKPLVLLFVLAGGALAYAWKPHTGGVRALASPDADIASVVSRPQVRLRSMRVIRKTEVVDISGNDVRVQLALRRPRIAVRLRSQTLFIEPCLNIEEGTIDGFFSIPPLNGYRLEPTGLALVDIAEGRLKRGGRSIQIGWTRVAFPKGKAEYGKLAGIAPFLGRLAGPDSIAATIEVEVDLQTGRITIDATTRLHLPVSVHSASLCWIRLLKIPSPRPLTFGVGDGLDAMPQPRAADRPPKQLEFAVAEGEVIRFLRAKSGDEGPYETRDVGPFDHWILIPGQSEPLLLVLPDWAGQASLRPSRTAGHGLPENSLQYWHQKGGINLLFDLASTRIGPGRMSTQLPAGTYRNRIVIRPLRGLSPGQAAKEELARLKIATLSGPVMKKVEVEAPPEPGNRKPPPPDNPGARPGPRKRQ